jgi:hypothetical protein
MTRLIFQTLYTTAALAYAVTMEILRFAGTTIVATTCALVLFASAVFFIVPQDQFVGAVVPPSGIQHVWVVVTDGREKASSDSLASPFATMHEVTQKAPVLTPARLATAIANALWKTMHAALLLAWIAGITFAAVRRAIGQPDALYSIWGVFSREIRAMRTLLANQSERAGTS